ncbi:hypothetical protein MHYP_G00366670 [Metynnis hypsauchen]
MNITWTRPDLGDALVHFYGNHKDVNTRQIPQYRGRTALFTEELQNGDVSLRLSDVDLPDKGEYKCRVESRFWEGHVSFNLRVEVLGTRPVISVESYDSNSKQFSLLCESKGWQNEPDLQWLDVTSARSTAESTLVDHVMAEEIKPSTIYDWIYGQMRFCLREREKERE